MGAGPNPVLSKGYKATGSAAYIYGQPVTSTAAVQSCGPISVADTYVLGVCQENVDAAKVTTGNVILNVQVMGITRALAGAAFAKNDPLTVDATGRFITQATAGGKFFAVAEEAATTAGQLVEVRLIDGYATI